jgi:hypothetical protein
MGNSAALLTARNDSSREAVTRDAELQSSRRRMVHVLYVGNGEILSWLLESNRQPPASRSHLRASMTVVSHRAGGWSTARVRTRGRRGCEPLITRPSPRVHSCRCRRRSRERTTCHPLTRLRCRVNECILRPRFLVLLWSVAISVSQQLVDCCWVLRRILLRMTLFQ